MGDLAAEEFLVAIERLDHDLGVATAVRHHVDGRELEVRRHPDLRHRDDVAFKIGIVNVAVRQDFRERMAHGLADAQLALRAAGSGTLLMMAGHCRLSNSLWPRIAVRRTASLPLAYVRGHPRLSC